MAPPLKTTEPLTLEGLKALVKSGAAWKRLFSVSSVDLRIYRLDRLLFPFHTALLIRFLSFGSCSFIDEEDRRTPITVSLLLRWGRRYLTDYFSLRRIARQADQELQKWEKPDKKGPPLKLKEGPAVYLRTDLWFGLKAGGSVGHVAGVVNQFEKLDLNPILFTTDDLPLISRSLSANLIPPPPVLWDFPEMLPLVFSRLFSDEVTKRLGQRPVSFFYQRYSHNNYSGVILAREHRVPLVVEYNGSEAWIRKNWGWGGLRFPGLTERVEMLNLTHADLIVVVSRALKEELIQRGLPAAKIAIVPNGVDVERYRPDTNGEAIREKYHLKNKVVIGFMGTFGPWHGTEILAESAVRLIRRRPDLQNRVHFLFMGDGARRPQVEAILNQNDMKPHCTLTGRVEQELGPLYLAACDILASPHVPNSDGSPFFGSPTKLFEYMAMGKPIVASRLGQIGEVIEDDRTGFLVTPGNPDELAAALEKLIEDASLRSSLGENARKVCVSTYSWESHTRSILQKLKNLCAGAPPVPEPFHGKK